MRPCLGKMACSSHATHILKLRKLQGGCSPAVAGGTEHWKTCALQGGQSKWSYERRMWEAIEAAAGDKDVALALARCGVLSLLVGWAAENCLLPQVCAPLPLAHHLPCNSCWQFHAPATHVCFLTWCAGPD